MKSNGKKRATKAKPRRRRSLAYRLPPLPREEREAFKRFMDDLAKMTDAERWQTIIDAGICTKSGKLRKPYAPQPDDYLAR